MDTNKLIQPSNSSICSVDLEGNFNYVNPAFSQVNGYSSEELRDKKFKDLLYPEDLISTAETFYQLLKGKELLNFETSNVHKDEFLRYISWTTYVVPDEEAVYAIGDDVTSQRLSEHTCILGFLMP
ncbi:MAG: PAS domain S-box-containing protein [Cyclobacteriaceae bacterium]|jgi:PAS domain S-box-containing protein